LEVDDQARPSTQIHKRNERKTPQITMSKIGPKIPLKIFKNEKHCSSTWEMNQHKNIAMLMQIKSLQGVEITQTSSRSLGVWRDLSLLSPLL
jgi:hypothetical protein